MYYGFNEKERVKLLLNYLAKILQERPDVDIYFISEYNNYHILDEREIIEYAKSVKTMIPYVNREISTPEQAIVLLTEGGMEVTKLTDKRKRRDNEN